MEIWGKWAWPFFLALLIWPLHAAGISFGWSLLLVGITAFILLFQAGQGKDVRGYVLLAMIVLGIVTGAGFAVRAVDHRPPAVQPPAQSYWLYWQAWYDQTGVGPGTFTVTASNNTPYTVTVHKVSVIFQGDGNPIYYTVNFSGIVPPNGSNQFTFNAPRELRNAPAGVEVTESAWWS